MPDQPSPQQTQQNPAGGTGPDTGSAGAGQAGGQQTAPTGQQAASTPPWGDDPSKFDPQKAWTLIENLRNDKSTQAQQVTALSQQVEQLKTGSISRDALATALGVKAEEVSDTQRLTEQLTGLTDRLNAAERTVLVQRVADEHKVPLDARHMLTATDPAELAKQAEFLGTRLGGGQGGAGGAEGQNAGQGAGGTQQTPGFVSSNGQGQGGGRPPGIPEQIAAAEAARQALTQGSPERKAADEKVAQLKTQQLMALRPQ